MGAAMALYCATCHALGQYGNGIRFPINLSAAMAISVICFTFGGSLLTADHCQWSCKESCLDLLLHVIPCGMSGHEWAQIEYSKAAKSSLNTLDGAAALIITIDALVRGSMIGGGSGSGGDGICGSGEEYGVSGDDGCNGNDNVAAAAAISASVDDAV
ncbi:hypothetical protein Tco_0807458, partial [Tanacetum coccineum]